MIRRLAFAATSAAALAATAQADLSGHWRGEAEGQEIQLDLTQRPDGTVAGRMRGVRAMTDLPIQNSFVSGETTVVDLPGIAFKYEFRLDGDRLEGTVIREDRSFDLELERAGPLAPERRAQDPALPPPYRVEEVRFAGAPGFELAGTLTAPQGAGPFPAVLLIGPDGAQDRDAAAAGHRPYAVLADALTQAGFAVLRYDDRGVGGSSGLFDSGDIDAYAADAAGALAFLKSRPEIDAARLAVLGRNNGAALAAKAGAAQGAAAFVLVSAPETDGRASANRQTESGMREAGESDGAIAERIAIQNKLFDFIVANPGLPSSELNAQLISIIRDEAGMLSMLVSDEFLMGVVRRLTTPWFRQFIAYDPKPDYARLAKPALVVYGAQDQTNPPASAAPAVEAALRSGGSTPTVAVLPGLGAGLATAPADPDASPWTRDETLAPAAIEAIVTWLAQTLKAS